MVTIMSTTYHLISNFNKRDKNDFLEEQPGLMEEIRAPPPVVVFLTQRMGAPHRNLNFAFINL